MQPERCKAHNNDCTILGWREGMKSWTVKPERSYTRRKLRPQKQWDGTQGLLRVWRQHRNIEKKWIDFRENWRKPAWITHSTKNSALCASAGEVLASTELDHAHSLVPWIELATREKTSPACDPIS
jgi:hypothetical protein